MLMTPKQAATKLTVSRQTVERLSKEGKFRSIKIRGSVRYDSEDIDNYISSLLADNS